MSGGLADGGQQVSSGSCWVQFGSGASAGSQVTEVVDHEQIKSVYFTDPNGIALEASYWVIDATGRPMNPGDARVFADPDPVPAVAELAAGRLGSVPATSLV